MSIMKKQISIPTLSIAIFFCVSCGNGEAFKAGNSNFTANKTQDTSTKAETSTAVSVNDDAAIATIETNDFILKVHKAIPFTLKPKSYQPFKVDPSKKLIALDISVRSKLTKPINFSRILGMAVIKGKGEKNLLAPWVVAAYEVNYPEQNHQKEYDALWSESFEPNGFHRAILFGINPSKDEKNSH